MIKCSCQWPSKILPCWVVLAFVLVQSSLVSAQEERAVEAGLRAVENVPDQVKKVRLSHAEKYLKSRISFLKSALELTQEQSEALRKLNKEWLEEIYQQNPKAAKKRAAGGAGFIQALVGGVQPMPQQPEGGPNDAIVQSLKSEVDKKINSLISEEQAKQLVAEEKAREAFRDKAMAEFTVSLIDRQTYLKDDQVQRLKELLNGKINRNVGWTVYLHNPQYLPMIPKKALQEVLSENQLKQILQMQQNDFPGHEFNIMQIFGQDDAEVEFAGEEELSR